MTGRPTGLHHFFVAASDVRDGVVELTGDEARHAARVLRVRPGEAITVADGSGRVIEAVVTEAEAVVRAEVRDIRETAPPKPAVTLYQAIAKGDRMNDLVAQAVEVGVVRFVPFVAQRTIAQWDERKRAKHAARWREIAKAAAKQSRSPYLTAVEDVVDGPSSLLASGTLTVVLDEASSVRLRDALPSAPPDAMVIAVGPEGGFAPDELGELRTGDAHIVTLGPRILRTGTAGPVAAAIVAYTYGTLG